MSFAGHLKAGSRGAFELGGKLGSGYQWLGVVAPLSSLQCARASPSGGQARSLSVESYAGDLLLTWLP